MVFSNVYTAKGSVRFTAVKELVGKKITDKQFSFVLTDKDGNILQTVYNDVDGNILFDEIFFNQDELGEYLYRIYEVAGDQEGFTYDKTVYFLTVIVTDNGEGTLNTAVSVQRENDGTKTDTTKIMFANQYEEPIIPSGPDPVPDTGDRSPVLWYVLLASSAFFIMLIIKRKKAIK